MKIRNRILSALTAAALSASACMSTVGSMGTAVAATEMTAIELVDDMGMGWNLGNTFDCWGGTQTPTWEQWGNKDADLTQALFDTVKASGFDSVRIPITWSQHTDSSSYDIEDDYLAKIKTIVDFCYNNDMYVIINMHWDWVSDGSQWLNQGLGAKTQFTTMWTEIANYFKDYDNKLVFEGMNEVKWTSVDGQPYTDNDYNIVNTLNQAFVDTVRATNGNNADRLLLIAGANTNQDNTCNAKFVVPDDDMLAVSIHYYDPGQWCIAEPGASWGYSETWGTDAEVQQVYNDFNDMKNYFVSQGIPVIIGEYGVLTNHNYQDLNKSDEDIAHYLKTVASAGLTTEGISTFLWDDGCGGHPRLNRTNLTWNEPAVQAAYNELATSDVDVPEGLMYTDRVSYSTDLMEVIGTSPFTQYNIDLSPYKDLGVTLKTVVIEGNITCSGSETEYGGGGTLNFSSKINGATTGGWTSESWYINAGSTSNVVQLDGVSADDDGNEYTYEDIEFDYLNINTWYTWVNPLAGQTSTTSTATLTIDKVTLIFDRAFFINDDGTVIIPEEETTEPTTEEPTVEPTTEEPTAEPTTEGEGDINYGDANNDGTVNINDAVLIMSYMANSSKYVIESTDNADVYQRGDGISIGDANAIQKFLAKIIKTLPES